MLREPYFDDAHVLSLFDRCGLGKIVIARSRRPISLSVAKSFCTTASPSVTFTALRRSNIEFAQKEFPIR
jgi:hypothetical protein